MSVRSISWGLKSGSLNLLEPPGPVTACNGIALPLHDYEILLFIPFYNGAVSQEEDSFHQQIGLKFKEETSKVLHLEYSLVRWRNVNTSDKIRNIWRVLKCGPG
jgi:hypothetical protein